MSIEHFRFLTCDACGARFRSDQPGVALGARVLCGRCSGTAGGAAADEAPAEEVTEEQVFRELDDHPRPARAPLPPRPVLPPLAAAEAGGDLPAGAAPAPLGPLPELSVQLPRKRVRSRRRQRQRSRRRRSWQSSEGAGGRSLRRGRRRRVWRWPRRLGIGVAVAALAVAGIWQLQELGRNLARARRAEAAPDLRGPIRTLPDLLAAQQVAGRFVAASMPAEVLPLVRPWDGVAEALTGFFATWQPVADPDSALSPMPPEIEGGCAYQLFGMILPDGRGCLVPVVPTAAGPKVDFKAVCEWSSVPAAQLLDGSIEEAGEVRAMLRPSTYYNYGFVDSERYLAFDATLGALDRTLVFYAPRGGDEARRIGEAVGPIGMHPVTVAIRSVDGSFRHQQFLITRLLAIGFVVPDPPVAGRGR